MDQICSCHETELPAKPFSGKELRHIDDPWKPSIEELKFEVELWRGSETQKPDYALHLRKENEYLND